MWHTKKTEISTIGKFGTNKKKLPSDRIFGLIGELEFFGGQGRGEDEDIVNEIFATLSLDIILPVLLCRCNIRCRVACLPRPSHRQIRVTPVAGRKDAPLNARSGGGGGIGGVIGRRRAPIGEREHGARIRDMVMRAAHAGYVEEDELGSLGGDAGVWSKPLSSVDSLSRQLKDTWDNFNDSLAVMKAPRRQGGLHAEGSPHGGPLPEY